MTKRFWYLTAGSIIGASLLIWIASECDAAPPTGYNMVFQSNFNGRGGNADGWLPIVEWSPLQPYVLGNELWYPEFIDHTPDGRDFGYATFTPSTATQAYGRMNWQPYEDSNLHWYGGLISTCDNQGIGFTVSPPFYATVYMTLPIGSDVWPAFWMTTVNRILPRPQTTNAAEIDVIEMYGNDPYTQEIHVNTRDANNNNLTQSAAFASNPGALNQYGQFYSVWVDSIGGTIHFYVESGTWNGLPAGDIHEVFNCPFVANGMAQPWYLMVNYALTPRGGTWVNPGPMWVKQFNVSKP